MIAFIEKVKKVFEQIAKDLLRQKPPAKEALEKANALVELANSGFSVKEICQEVRELYDNCEDPTIKKQLLDMVIKVHGLYSQDDKRETPKIIFNVVGDPARVQTMLCPPHMEENAA